MTTQIENVQEVKTTQNSIGRLIWVSLLAMITTAVANLGLYAVAGNFFPEVTTWSGAGIGQIIGAGNGYLFVGAIVFAIIKKKSSRPARHYLIIATLGLLLSLVMPISAGFGVPAASPATVVTLSLMHLLSYAISVPMFIRMALD